MECILTGSSFVFVFLIRILVAYLNITADKKPDELNKTKYFLKARKGRIKQPAGHGSVVGNKF